MTFVKRLASLSAIAVIIAAAMATAADASELYLLGGRMLSFSPSESSYSWQLEYRQDLLKHIAAGVSYLNEGHINKHHRDGYTAQFWARTELLQYRLTLAAGVGPYFYLDTVSDFTPRGFSNDHGWKAMMSVAGAYHFQNDLILELRSNWVQGGGGFDAASVLAGIGYHFDPNLEPVRGPESDLKNEVTVFVGQTIVNSFSSQHSIASALEYRRAVVNHLDWTLGGIYEGDNRLDRKWGIVTQIWASQQLRDGMFSVAAGAGPYFDIGHNDSLPDGDHSPVAGMLTLTASYRFRPHWSLRASWNRLVTSNDRDTDIILGGLGYRF